MIWEAGVYFLFHVFGQHFNYIPAKSTFELKLQVALPCNTNFVKVDVTIRRLKVVLTECIKRSQAILLI